MYQQSDYHTEKDQHYGILDIEGLDDKYLFIHILKVEITHRHLGCQSAIAKTAFNLIPLNFQLNWKSKLCCACRWVKVHRPLRSSRRARRDKSFSHCRWEAGNGKELSYRVATAICSISQWWLMILLVVSPQGDFFLLSVLPRLRSGIHNQRKAKK